MTQCKGKRKGKGCVVDDDGGHHPIVFRDLTPRVHTFEYRPEFEKKCAPCDFRLADEKMEMRSIHSCPTGLRPAPPEAGGRGIGGDSLSRESSLRLGSSSPSKRHSSSGHHAPTDHVQFDLIARPTVVRVPTPLATVNVTPNGASDLDQADPFPRMEAVRDHEGRARMQLPTSWPM